MPREIGIIAGLRNFAAAGAGCIGNRVYTGLRDDELYFSIPVAQLDAVLAKLETITNANKELEVFHRNRRAAAF